MHFDQYDSHTAMSAHTLHTQKFIMNKFNIFCMQRMHEVIIEKIKYCEQNNNHTNNNILYYKNRLI